MATESPEPLTGVKHLEQTSEKGERKDSIEDGPEKITSRELDHEMPQKDSQLPSLSSTHRKAKKQEESLLAAVCAWIVEHQIG